MNEIGVDRKLGAKAAGPPDRLKSNDDHSPNTSSSNCKDARRFIVLLDYDAAADYLCTTPRHVRELWAKRFLPAVKVGRYVRFTRRTSTLSLKQGESMHCVEADHGPLPTPSFGERPVPVTARNGKSSATGSR